MSLIFDALQRSEAERSGVDLSALSAATEVLQLAELHAVSERKLRSSNRARRRKRQRHHSRWKQRRCSRDCIRSMPSQRLLANDGTRKCSANSNP
jgi:hypothetical protein